MFASVYFGTNVTDKGIKGILLQPSKGEKENEIILQFLRRGASKISATVEESRLVIRTWQISLSFSSGHNDDQETLERTAHFINTEGWRQLIGEKLQIGKFDPNPNTDNPYPTYRMINLHTALSFAPS